MGLFNIVKKIIYPDSYNGEVYVKTLQNKYHIDIGEHCRIWEPNHTYIDIQRPHMLHIGDYVKITRGVTILTHDFSRSVFTGAGYNNVGEARETWIGNNVFIGMNAIILMGAYIVDNSIIGAGSVVSGCFDNGSVIAGNPGRFLCSIGDYYNKMKQNEINSAKKYATRWKEKYKQWPSVEEMTDAFAWLYLPRKKESIDIHPLLFRPGGVNKEMYISSFLNSSPEYESFEHFIDDCRKDLDKE